MFVLGIFQTDLWCIGMEKGNNKDKKKSRVLSITSTILKDKSIVEMVYDERQRHTSFAVSLDGEISYTDQIETKEVTYIPLKPSFGLVRHNVMLFPSKGKGYGSKEELLAEIQSFIHCYVDISKNFEKIASYYVLLSWVYENYSEIPYLRKRGGFGSGKTRFLQTIGSICYRPIFANGGASSASLFHTLDKYGGTLIIDEGDFRFSDAKADIAKILNNGNTKGSPILRLQIDSEGNYTPVAYQVFSPKIISSRGYFEDRALESRIISENSNPEKLREDISITLPKEFRKQALELRNKLLSFRFNHAGEGCKDISGDMAQLEPRIRQMFLPIFSLIDDQESYREILDFAENSSGEIVIDRTDTAEAHLLTVIHSLISKNKELRIKDISNKFREEFSDSYFRKVTPKWIGWLIRKKLGLKTHKTHGGYTIDSCERKTLDKYFEKYEL